MQGGCGRPVGARAAVLTLRPLFFTHPLAHAHTHSLYKLALPMSADQLLSFSASVISSTVVARLGEREREKRERARGASALLPGEKKNTQPPPLHSSPLLSKGSSTLAALFLGRSLVNMTGLSPVLGSVSAVETFSGAAHGHA